MVAEQRRLRRKFPAQAASIDHVASRSNGQACAAYASSRTRRRLVGTGTPELSLRNDSPPDGDGGCAGTQTQVHVGGRGAVLRQLCAEGQRDALVEWTTPYRPRAMGDALTRGGRRRHVRRLHDKPWAEWLREFPRQPRRRRHRRRDGATKSPDKDRQRVPQASHSPRVVGHRLLTAEVANRRRRKVGADAAQAERGDGRPKTLNALVESKRWSAIRRLAEENERIRLANEEAPRWRQSSAKRARGRGRTQATRPKATRARGRTERRLEAERRLRAEEAGAHNGATFARHGCGGARIKKKRSTRLTLRTNICDARVAVDKAATCTLNTLFCLPWNAHKDKYEQQAVFKIAHESYENQLARMDRVYGD